VTNLASGLFITVNTHWPSGFILCCSVTVRHTQQTAAAEQSSYCYMRYSTHCSRDKHLARPVINKKKWKEIIFSHAWSEERWELSMIKLSLWLTYSTYENAREKRKKTASTKKLMCVNYTTSERSTHCSFHPAFPLHFTFKIIFNKTHFNCASARFVQHTS